MKLINKPGSIVGTCGIIGTYVYYEGRINSRRLVTGIRHWQYGATILCKNDDGSDNSGPYEAYTVEPNGRYLTLQDIGR